MWRVCRLGVYSTWNPTWEALEGIPGNKGRTDQAAVAIVVGFLAEAQREEGGRDSAVREGLQRTNSEPTPRCAGRDGRL